MAGKKPHRRSRQLSCRWRWYCCATESTAKTKHVEKVWKLVSMMCFVIRLVLLLLMSDNAALEGILKANRRLNLARLRFSALRNETMLKFDRQNRLGKAIYSFIFLFFLFYHRITFSSCYDIVRRWKWAQMTSTWVKCYLSRNGQWQEDPKERKNQFSWIIFYRSSLNIPRLMSVCLLPAFDFSPLATRAWCWSGNWIERKFIAARIRNIWGLVCFENEWRTLQEA